LLTRRRKRKRNAATTEESKRQNKRKEHPGKGEGEPILCPKNVKSIARSEKKRATSCGGLAGGGEQKKKREAAVYLGCKRVHKGAYVEARRKGKEKEKDNSASAGKEKKMKGSKTANVPAERVTLSYPPFYIEEKGQEREEREPHPFSHLVGKKEKKKGGETVQA